MSAEHPLEGRRSVTEKRSFSLSCPFPGAGTSLLDSRRRGVPDLDPSVHPVPEQAVAARHGPGVSQDISHRSDGCGRRHCGGAGPVFNTLDFRFRRGFGAGALRCWLHCAGAVVIDVVSMKGV